MWFLCEGLLDVVSGREGDTRGDRLRFFSCIVVFLVLLHCMPAIRRLGGKLDDCTWWARAQLEQQRQTNAKSQFAAISVTLLGCLLSHCKTSIRFSPKTPKTPKTKCQIRRKIVQVQDSRPILDPLVCFTILHILTKFTYKLIIHPSA